MSTIYSHILSYPDFISPSNDIQGISFQLTNSTYTLNNFKYLTKLYSRDIATSPHAGSETFVVQENVPPRPTTGYGLYSPYQPLLSLLSYKINVGIDTTTQPVGCLQAYNIQYGSEWNPDLTISNIYQISTHFGITTTTPHGLTASDIITIQSQNPWVNGTQTILTVIDANNFSISAIWSPTFSVVSGYITDVKRWYPVYTDYFYAFNGTRQYSYQNTNYYTSYVMGQVYPPIVANTPFLTDYPQEAKLIMLNQSETLSFFIDPYYMYADNMRLYFNFYDSTGASIAFSDTTVSCGTYSLGGLYPSPYAIQRWDTPVGTSYITSELAIDLSSVDTYDVGVYNVSFAGAPHLVPISELRTFKIDRDQVIYQNVRLMWLNSFGAFDYFNFRLDDHKSYNVTRTEYKQILPFDYTTGQRQRTIMANQVVEQHVVNTNWITESQLAFVNNILISTEVYVINETNLLPYPIIITDNNVDYKTAYRDQIFNLTLTYETSYDINTQHL